MIIFLKQTLLKIAVLNLFFLLLMSLWRLVFFLYYGQGMDFSGLNSDIARAFFMGFRFDLSIIAYINALVILAFICLLFIGKAKFFEPFFRALKYYYGAIVGLTFIIYAVDFGFYSYFQSHINTLVFGFFEDDTLALISTFHKNYNLFLIFLAIAAFCFGIFKLSKVILKNGLLSISTPPPPTRKIFIPKTIISVVLLAATFLMMRGTVGDFPLSVHYGVSSNAFINAAAQNPLYALQAAIEARVRDRRDPDYIALSGYDDIRAAFADYLNADIKEIPQENPEDSLMNAIAYNKEVESLKPNVIFIVMESFGTDLIKYNSASFDVLGELKKHFDKDYVFYNFLPAYSSTVGSMEAVISNIARRQGSVFLSISPYADKKYKFSGPRPYKAAGFQTFFVYGGNSSWRNSAAFMRNLGFDFAIGSDGMNGKHYPENEWGVFDEYLFDYVYEILESNEEQKFIFVLTTTNHPPYTLPQDYEPLPLDIPSNLDKKIVGRSLAKARFAAYQYSNHALGRFIDKIKSSPMGQRTIIAVTGDHNFKNIYGYSKEETFDSVRVPFYLYIPPKLRKGNVDTKVFGSHLDIMPTLYNLSLSDAKVWTMGTDLLSKKAQNNIAVHIDIIMDADFVVVYDFDLPTEFYLWNRKLPANIVASKKTAGHGRLIKHFLAMNAVSDYILKKTGESLR